MTGPDDRTSDYAEFTQRDIDASKHLTTLAAGSIVVIGTFIKDIFPNENGTIAVGLAIKILIAAAFVLFGIALAFVALGMFGLTRSRIAQSGRYANWEALLFLFTPFVSFVVGIFCFGLAVLINLF
jgi:hypothetical protein